VWALTIVKTFLNILAGMVCTSVKKRKIDSIDTPPRRHVLTSLGLLFLSNLNISNKHWQCRNTDFWTDDTL
jgi:hypothetical protein